jgi:hypothetical protein
MEMEENEHACYFFLSRIHILRGYFQVHRTLKLYAWYALVDTSDCRACSAEGSQAHVIGGCTDRGGTLFSMKRTVQLCSYSPGHKTPLLMSGCAEDMDLAGYGDVKNVTVLSALQSITIYTFPPRLVLRQPV